MQKVSSLTEKEREGMVSLTMVIIAMLVLGVLLTWLAVQNVQLEAKLNAKPKFGLAEAGRAREYVDGDAKAKAILAVVVTILGHENTVLAELKAELNKKIAADKESVAQIAKARKQIKILEGEIGSEADMVTSRETRHAALANNAKPFIG